MAITKILGTVIPALYIGHEGKNWTIAGTIMEINVVGDQVLLPEGLNVYIRLTVEGHGKLDAALRLKQYESDDVLHTQAIVMNIPPPEPNQSQMLSTWELTFRLPVDRLYPAVAASSLGTAIKSTFLLELMVPEGILDPGFEGPTEFTPAMVIAAAPLYLVCNPKQTITQGTRA